MPEPIRILNFITELRAGGAQTALVRLLARLPRDRFIASVACLFGSDTAIGERLRDDGIPVYDLGMSSKWRLGAFRRFRNVLNEVRPTILHATLYHPTILSRWYGRRCGVPVIITSRRNTEIGGPLRGAVLRCTRGADDRVVAVCEAARQAELRQTGVREEKVVTIHNGIDANAMDEAARVGGDDLRSTYGIPRESLLVGTVARLCPQKNIALLLDAFHRIESQRDVYLLIVGHGSEKSGLEDRARRMGIKDRVIFTGEEVHTARLLSILDVFVLSSDWEGLPNAILEAMALSRPVVATSVGGVPEIIEDGVTGLLVDPGRANALANRLTCLCDDAALRGQLGAAGRARVVTDFSIDRMVQRTVDLYEEVLVEKGVR